MMICIFLHLLLVFCFSPPNISKRFCCWQLFWKAIETRPRRLLVFILGLIQISVTFYAGMNYFFPTSPVAYKMVEFEMLVNNVDWGIGRLVKNVVGWVEEVGWLWLKGNCWMGLILLWLEMTNSFIAVERRVVWGWKSGWLGLRDWLVGIERFVGWGWEIGLVGLRDWFVGVKR